ncbi:MULTISPECIES: DUF3313 domain-containing protein [Erwiniaceae]|uniref:DUF3313 domain-containing protein n=1 Tax=Erwiniaceae TaxID=1903409 RepID=UPI00190AF0F4|nr:MULTISPECIES: DUF3313 domain-containing protein [Erwiniaceae]MBK0000765.1 DUF3313 domain-containing protein [Erwinia sp. S38]MBM7344979.1 hypothetical protein [Pantoea coffeiphila]MCW1873025.1 DUF3313 domain-containing protein [Erwinia sp. INIA01]
MALIARKIPSLALLASVALLAGCAGSAPNKYAGLDSSSRLTANPSEDSDRIPFKYASPVNWKKYDSINIAPVTIYQGSDGQFNDVERSDRQQLADYMQKKFSEVLGKKFKVVSSPAPGTLNLKLTLTGADTTPQVIGTFTKFDLAGGPYNIVQSVRGGRGLMSGYVNYAVEIHDAATNELLLAYIAEQYPNAMNVGATFGALSAAETGIDKGADQLLEKLQ